MADPSDVDVRWLDPIDPNQGDMEPSSETATVMPIFPLGVTYLPYTTTVLNIFEPRYRQMFNDILMNGARRFAVLNVDSETGRFAEVGVIFYLDELKEVSEQTDDRVKYIGANGGRGPANWDNIQCKWFVPYGTELGPFGRWVQDRRTYLRTSFAEKDTVKSHGAEWDRDRRSWFVPGYIEDLSPFRNWIGLR